MLEFNVGTSQCVVWLSWLKHKLINASIQTVVIDVVDNEKYQLVKFNILSKAKKTN